VDLRLPPRLIGWDVGTFEFLSDRISTSKYIHKAKIRLRTGGSIGSISGSYCHLEHGEGCYWDLPAREGSQRIRLPVKHRYRSPIIFEFHVSGKRKADAYAILWLNHLVDNEDTPINVPIWTTSAPHRLTQNFITEDNCHDEIGLEDLKEVGRLHFNGRFKAGMDESHEQFIQDNDSRETFETWEACVTEGVRSRIVEVSLPDIPSPPPGTEEDASPDENRRTLYQDCGVDEDKWTDKDGTNWSGAFGHDPAISSMDDVNHEESGQESDHYDSSDEELNTADVEEHGNNDLGIRDATNPERIKEKQMENIEMNKQSRRTLARKHRGAMQWKPARNLKYAVDEGKLGLRKLKQKVGGGLNGRQPGVETGKHCFGL
jgi:hypothetical protein